MGAFAELGSSILLFFLVFGMSATVEVRQLRKQLKNGTALAIGISLQFLILPFVGFVVVKVLQLPAAMGITLLVVTSSPGGSYSNWWCSMFNAELALSVTMTAISTLLSIIMLPVNLIIYTRWTYSSDVVESLDWFALFLSLVVVIGGILCGFIFSARAERLGGSIRLHHIANKLGNMAGLALITLSISVSSSDHQAALWDQDVKFYLGVAMPAILGLAISTYLASKFDLEKPERVAVAVEACYQNTGIATSVALTMFSRSESDLATAIGVPLYYGIVEAAILAVYCVVCWKAGWTKAPKDENVCSMLFNSFEVNEIEDPKEEEGGAVEVVLSSPNNKEASHDVVFAQSKSGGYIVDEESLGNKEKHHRGPLEAPSSPTLSSKSTDSGSESLSEQIQVPMPREKNTRIKNPIASIKARATGYRMTPASSEAHAKWDDVPTTSPTSGGAQNDLEQPSSTPDKKYLHLPSESPLKSDGALPVLGKALD